MKRIDHKDTSPQERLMGKADKVPAWKGSSTERWQEFRNSLTAWYFANGEFLTQAQTINKIAEMFKGAGETATADSLFGYSQVGATIPPFEDILYDLSIAFIK